MLVIDVLVPARDVFYDFELDERKKVEELLEDMVSFIEEKEGRRFEDRQALQLYSLRGGEILDKKEAIGWQDVRSGDRLLLI